MKSPDWNAFVDWLRIYRSPGALPALDGLRAVAILLVVSFHGSLSMGHGQPLMPILGTDLLAPVLTGWMGVNLFFVLSGFLITHHLLRAWHGPPTRAQVWRYLTKRWLRIVPTYYVVLMVVWLGLVPYRPMPDGATGFQLLYHLLFLQDYLPSSIVAPFWSLGVEEKFYLLMPLVVLLLLNIASARSRLLVLGSIAAAPLLFRLLMYQSQGPVSFGEYILYWRNPFHLNLDALFLGATAALLTRHRSRIPWLAGQQAGQRLVAAGMVMTLGVMYWVAIGSAAPLASLVLVNSIVALAFTVLLLGAAVRQPDPRRWLDHPLLGAVGRLAFPWYLTHTIVLWWIAPAMAGTPLMLSMTVYFMCSMLVGLLLHWAVERPCLLLKQSLDQGRVAVPEAAT